VLQAPAPKATDRRVGLIAHLMCQVEASEIAESTKSSVRSPGDRSAAPAGWTTRTWLKSSKSPAYTIVWLSCRGVGATARFRAAARLRRRRLLRITTPQFPTFNTPVPCGPDGCVRPNGSKRACQVTRPTTTFRGIEACRKAPPSLILRLCYVNKNRGGCVVKDSWQRAVGSRQ